MNVHALVIIFLSIFLSSECLIAQDIAHELKGWKTNTAIRSVELSELMSGGPAKDGIPSINKPKFVSIEAASDWLKGQEPVILLSIGGTARAYPLQILTWHEIVNDVIDSVPVVVTFCPLCYAALAFDRRIDGKTYSFGVSGMLRHSDMVMYDRETETLWQQLSGEGIIGDLTGTTLVSVPAQIISFNQYKTAYPNGEVLSKDTGHRRDYGRNPYAGYDNIKERPFLYKGPFDKRVPPMEKVVTVSIDGIDKGYPHRVTRKKRVTEDQINGRHIIVFHADGAVSALDQGRISESKMIGSTGVFFNNIDGTPHSFSYSKEGFTDKETGSLWDITGKAFQGKLMGHQLKPIPHGNFFAFAWFAFKPDAVLYSGK